MKKVGAINLKWKPQDVETWISAKVYIDTALIPLYAVSMGDDIKQSSEIAEFITLLSNHLERQFTGRLLLFPPFTYLRRTDHERILSDLKSWEEDIGQAEFNYVFYLTSDMEWRKDEDSLNGTIILLPTIPLLNMSEAQKYKMIDSQVKQILSFFTEKWNEK